MTKETLPNSISPQFLDGALAALEFSDLELEFLSIPFSLRQMRLDEFDAFGEQFEDRFRSNRYGIVIHTERVRSGFLTGLPTNEFTLARPCNTLEFLKPDIRDDNGLLYLANTELLKGLWVSRGSAEQRLPQQYIFDGISSEKLYFWKPEHLPQTIIRTGHGQILFSPELPEALSKKLEDARYEDLQYLLEEMDGPAP